jgi:hypothetical protein
MNRHRRRIRSEGLARGRNPQPRVPVLSPEKISSQSRRFRSSTKWAVFLLSLRDWLERGEGRPDPYDVKIHVGD